MLSGKHIVLGVSGGIAAYKIPELIRLLVKSRAEVRVTTSRHALEFVTPLTLQTLSGAPVYSDVFAAINAHATEHISLPTWGDAMIVAPATANILAKAANGIADDALSTTIASCIARKPILFAPAMNDRMWDSPATQQAITTLRSFPGVSVLDPSEGFLACGVNGKGRMPEPPELLEALSTIITHKDLVGKQVLITAGGTREQIDPVRFISNYSTGKMGIALAHECARRGATVTLVAGSISTPILNPFGRIRRIDALTAEAMYSACMKEWPTSDIAILCAAVADFTPTPVDHKIKKAPGQTELTLSLHTTPDIAASLGSHKKEGQTLIGFALETDNELVNAQSKLRSKHLDLIVLNSLRDSGAGFGTDTNRVTLLRANGSSTTLPLLSKAEVASAIIDELI